MENTVKKSKARTFLERISPILLPSIATSGGLIYWVIILGIVLLPGILTVLLYVFIGKVAALLMVVLWILILRELRFKEIKIDQVSGVLCGGKYLFDGEPGYILETKSKLLWVSTDEAGKQEIFLPAKKDDIFHGSDKDPLPEGKVRPIRTTTASAKTAKYTSEMTEEMFKDDPTHTRLTIEPQGMAAIQIEQKNYSTYLRLKYGDLNEVSKNLFENIVGDEFSKRTPAMIIHDRNTIDARFMSDLSALVESIGLKATNAQLTYADLTRQINEALQTQVITRINALNAVQEKDATILRAEGERVRLVKEGMGKSEAVRLMKLAEAIGTQKLSEILKTDMGRLAAEMQLAKTFAESSASKFFFQDKPNLLTLAQVVSEMNKAN